MELKSLLVLLGPIWLAMLTSVGLLLRLYHVRRSQHQAAAIAAAAAKRKS